MKCKCLRTLRVRETMDPMNTTDFHHDLSAARQATGMTSRARRPEPHILAG